MQRWDINRFHIFPRVCYNNFVIHVTKFVCKSYRGNLMKRAAILSLVATCIFSASTAFAAVPSVHTSAVPSSTVTREASRTAAVPSASTRALPSGATTLPSQTKALPSMQRPGTAGAAEIAPQTLPDMSAFRIPPQSSAYAFHNDFGKSNLRKWSSTEGMDTPWNSNRTTDTVSPPTRLLTSRFA